MKILVGHGKEGMYHSFYKDAKHRWECQQLGVFRDVWPDRNGPLPWRLTREQVDLLEERMGRILWPHYVERLHYKKASVWKKSGRMWKCHLRW